MPNFKQFIKGFEDKPEQPEVKPQPKPGSFDKMIGDFDKKEEAQPEPKDRGFYDAEVGDMWVLPNDKNLKIKERQGRNVLVDYEGREEWYDIDDFVNIRGFDKALKYPHELKKE